MAGPSRGGRDVIVRRHAQALMYMAVLLQLLGAACALVAGPGTGLGAFRLPEGGEDGIYQGFVDENGETQVKYLGKANTTSPGPNVNPRGGIGGRGRKLLDTDSGVHCQGTEASLSIADAFLATTALANWFGDGNSFSGSYISVQLGSAIVYGCNYADGYHSQWTTSSAIWDDESAISDVCGGYDHAGWYAHESWKSSYGRCSVYFRFC